MIDPVEEIAASLTVEKAVSAMEVDFQDTQTTRREILGKVMESVRDLDLRFKGDPEGSMAKQSVVKTALDILNDIDKQSIQRTNIALKVDAGEAAEKYAEAVTAALKQISLRSEERPKISKSQLEAADKELDEALSQNDISDVEKSELKTDPYDFDEV